MATRRSVSEALLPVAASGPGRQAAARRATDGINLPILWKLVVPIILVNVAVLAEVFRAGILAVDRGQYEAAAALGLRDGVAMRAVILPQAIRFVVPALVTQLVALLKDSTLGYVVSYPELMKQPTTSPSTRTCWSRPI